MFGGNYECMEKIIKAFDQSEYKTSIYCAGSASSGEVYLFDSGGFLIAADEVKKMIRFCQSYLSSGSYLIQEHFNDQLLKLRENSAVIQYDKLGKNPKTTNIYLAVNNRNGYYKIGQSINPEIREKTLQSEEPEVEFIISFPGDKTTEKLLHDKYQDKRLRGEWFALNSEDVEFIKSLKDNK